MSARTDAAVLNAKRGLRERLKAVRDSMPALERAAASHAIGERVRTLAATQAARRTFVFISSGSEVHTHDLIHWLLARGGEVAVPKILPGKRMIASRLHHWSGLRPGQLGILTPEASEPVEGPFDLVITPGLGFTERGDRIGYGAGYYDRWFATHDARHRIAVAFEMQMVPDLPATLTDIPVEAIVTERRLIRVASEQRRADRSGPSE